MAQHPFSVRTKMTVLRHKSKQTIDNQMKLKTVRPDIARRSTYSKTWGKGRVSGTRTVTGKADLLLCIYMSWIMKKELLLITQKKFWNSFIMGHLKSILRHLFSFHCRWVSPVSHRATWILSSKPHRHEALAEECRGLPAEEETLLVRAKSQPTEKNGNANGIAHFQE